MPKLIVRLEGSFADLQSLGKGHADTLPIPIKALLGTMTRFTNETSCKGATEVSGVPLDYDLSISVTE
jgi:hypothetical protein